MKLRTTPAWLRRLARRLGSGYASGIRPRRGSGHGGWWRRLWWMKPWVVKHLRAFPEAAYELRVRRADGCWQVTVLDEDRREVVRVDATRRRETEAVLRVLLDRMRDGASERLPRGFRWFRSESGHFEEHGEAPFDPMVGDYGAGA